MCVEVHHMLHTLQKTCMGCHAYKEIKGTGVACYSFIAAGRIINCGNLRAKTLL